MKSRTDWTGAHDVSTALHRDRLDAVMEHLTSWRVEAVLDLGCGSGALLDRLLDCPQVRRVVGVDRSELALLDARRRLAVRDTDECGRRLALRQGCVTAAPRDLAGFDAAVLIETIEHLEPKDLSRLERSVFARLRPTYVVITTPNREYNSVYGLAGNELRHSEHRFEWGRTRFEAWACGVARRTGYTVALEGIGTPHAWLGSPTQMALFSSSTCRRLPGGSAALSSRRRSSRSAPRWPGR